MATHKATVRESSSNLISRRRRFPVSGMAVRVLIALIISLLIVMAFFVTGVVSH